MIFDGSRTGSTSVGATSFRSPCEGLGPKSPCCLLQVISCQKRRSARAETVHPACGVGCGTFRTDKLHEVTHVSLTSTGHPPRDRQGGPAPPARASRSSARVCYLQLLLLVDGCSAGTQRSARNLHASTKCPHGGIQFDSEFRRCLYSHVMKTIAAVLSWNHCPARQAGQSHGHCGDGQVTLGDTVIKKNARKIRRLHNDRVLVGFAGSTADAFALFSRLEARLEEFHGNLNRAAVELAQEWRTDRALRHLEAFLLPRTGNPRT